MTEGRQDPFSKAVENARIAAEGKPREPSNIQEAMHNLQTQAMTWLAKRTR